MTPSGIEPATCQFVAAGHLNIKYYCKWDPIHLNILRTICNKPLLKFLYNIGLMMAVMGMGETINQ